MSTVKIEVQVHEKPIVRTKRIRIPVNAGPDHRPPSFVSFWHASNHEGSMLWERRFGPFYSVVAAAESSMGSTYGYVDPDIVDPDSEAVNLAEDNEEVPVERPEFEGAPIWAILVALLFVGVGILIGRCMLN